MFLDAWNKKKEKNQAKDFNKDFIQMLQTQIAFQNIYIKKNRKNK